MVWLVWILIFGLVCSSSLVLAVAKVDRTQGVISWPVAKLLEFILGSHHGIMYRRAGKSCVSRFSVRKVLNKTHNAQN